MQCPSCRREIALGSDECLFCGSALPALVEEHIRRRFACTRCQHREAAMARVTMIGRQVADILASRLYEFLAVSCPRCSHTELFDLAVLERGGRTDDVLDLLFPTGTGASGDVAHQRDP